jgi:hypothetical protein
MSKRKSSTASTEVKKRDVVHPTFYEASNLIKDEFWKNFFIDLSKNKLCRKIHIDSKTVSHNSKKASFTYNYETKSLEEIAVELKKLISETLCIYSENDMNMNKEELNIMASEFKDVKTEDDWKKVKNRKMKDHLITNYVMKLKQQFKLTWLEARSAFNMIRSALFYYRTHKSCDITMENGEIQNIDDIIINDKEITNARIDQLNDEEKPVIKLVSLDKEWIKYSNNFLKKSKSYLCIEIEDAKKKKVTTIKEVDEKKQEVEEEPVIDEEYEEDFEEDKDDEKEEEDMEEDDEKEEEYKEDDEKEDDEKEEDEYEEKEDDES